MDLRDRGLKAGGSPSLYRQAALRNLVQPLLWSTGMALSLATLMSHDPQSYLQPLAW